MIGEEMEILTKLFSAYLQCQRKREGWYCPKEPIEGTSTPFSETFGDPMLAEA